MWTKGRFLKAAVTIASFTFLPNQIKSAVAACYSKGRYMQKLIAPIGLLSFKSIRNTMRPFVLPYPYRLILLVACVVACTTQLYAQAIGSSKGLRLSTFDVDATPPIGNPLTYDSTANSWDLGLRAKGIVLQGAGQPIVLVAVDWIGIANDSQDAFKEALAE